MTGKILIVDTIATNRIVLKVKLASAFYQVLQAANVDEAVRMACVELPDLIVTALDLPQGGTPDLCRALAVIPHVQHIPVLAIGGRAGAQPRLAALRAGARDVMTKPIDDALLLSRVRSLIRAHHASSEWRMREDTSEALGLAEAPAAFLPAGRCLLIGSDAARAKRWIEDLRPLLRCRLSWAKPADAVREVNTDNPADIFVLIQPEDALEGAAALRLVSTLRANAATRHAGVLVLQPQADAALGAQALDLGADDLMTDGFSPDELALRLQALQRRKQMDAQLRDTFRTGVRAAVHDPLTGLHNRRYAMPHLARIAERSAETGKPFAVMVADLDHFKHINDSHGHAAGDAVLVEVAARLRDALRAPDLVARIGGEEFLIVMPGTTLQDARRVAVRICNDIGARPFTLPDRETAIQVTVSIGMAIGGGMEDAGKTAADPGQALIDQADKALYSAKLRGRNRVTLSRPAA